MTKTNLTTFRNAAKDHVYKTYFVPFVSEFCMLFEVPELINIGKQMYDYIDMLSPVDLQNIDAVVRKPMQAMLLGNIRTAATR